MVTVPGESGTCLLVIDLQEGVVDGCFDAEGVLRRTSRLIGRAREADVPVVFVQHEAPDLRPGTADWRFAPGIEPSRTDPVVHKRFRDAFADTELAAVLTDLAVTRLVIAGAQSDYCVRTTLHRAAADGYDVTLIRDCHTTTDAAFGGVTVSGEQVIAHTNLSLRGLRYPGQTTRLAGHEDHGLFG